MLDAHGCHARGIWSALCSCSCDCAHGRQGEELQSDTDQGGPCAWGARHASMLLRPALPKVGAAAGCVEASEGQRSPQPSNSLQHGLPWLHVGGMEEMKGKEEAEADAGEECSDWEESLSQDLPSSDDDDQPQEGHPESGGAEHQEEASHRGKQSATSGQAKGVRTGTSTPRLYTACRAWPSYYREMCMGSESHAALLLHFVATLGAALVTANDVTGGALLQGTCMEPGPAAAVVGAVAGSSTVGMAAGSTVAVEPGQASSTAAGQACDTTAEGQPAYCHDGTVQQYKPLHVLYLGPQAELDMLDTFSELYRLLLPAGDAGDTVPRQAVDASDPRSVTAAGQQQQSAAAAAAEEEEETAAPAASCPTAAAPTELPPPNQQQVWLHFIGPDVPNAWHGRMGILRQPWATQLARPAHITAASAGPCGTEATGPSSAADPAPAVHCHFSTNFMSEAGGTRVQAGQHGKQGSMLIMCTFWHGYAHEVLPTLLPGQPQQRQPAVATQVGSGAQCGAAEAGSSAPVAQHTTTATTATYAEPLAALHQATRASGLHAAAPCEEKALQAEGDGPQDHKNHSGRDNVCDNPQQPPAKRARTGTGTATPSTTPGHLGPFHVGNTLVFAPNAGLAAYTSWLPTLVTLSQPLTGPVTRSNTNTCQQPVTNENEAAPPLGQLAPETGAGGASQPTGSSMLDVSQPSGRRCHSLPPVLFVTDYCEEALEKSLVCACTSHICIRYDYTQLMTEQQCMHCAFAGAGCCLFLCGSYLCT